MFPLEFLRLVSHWPSAWNNVLTACYCGFTSPLMGAHMMWLWICARSTWVATINACFPFVNLMPVSYPTSFASSGVISPGLKDWRIWYAITSPLGCRHVLCRYSFFAWVHLLSLSAQFVLIFLPSLELSFKTTSRNRLSVRNRHRGLHLFTLFL